VWYLRFSIVHDKQTNEKDFLAPSEETRCTSVLGNLQGKISAAIALFAKIISNDYCLPNNGSVSPVMSVINKSNLPTFNDA
jgi:hypothetical protein